jgi:tetratricopeptide (TPR) repeat protein
MPIVCWRARRLGNNGRMPEALGLLERCLVLRPDSYRTWFLIANVHSGMTNWPKAIEACEEAIKLHPTADRQEVRIEMLLKWRATFLFQAKRYNEAIVGPVFISSTEFDSKFNRLFERPMR